MKITQFQNSISLLYFMITFMYLDFIFLTLFLASYDPPNW